MKKAGQRSLDFEINLLPVISILSVCLGFLLLTAVWVNVGTFDVSQALGTQATTNDNKEPAPTLWLTFTNNGSVQVIVKNAKSLADRYQINTVSGLSKKVNNARISDLVKKIKKMIPQLNTALVIPAPETSYEEMIAVMDNLKKINISEIGVAPL